MKKFLLVIFSLIAVLLIGSIVTKKIDLQKVKKSVQESFSKVLEPIENPAELKENTERKIKDIEKKLKEKADESLKK